MAIGIVKTTTDVREPDAELLLGSTVDARVVDIRAAAQQIMNAGRTW